ncbi:MAG: hypothetical protein IIA19_07915 [Thaumarchaeota archaeon]|nr:hypothetical protein [Nitrososphaerota archaeon]
MVEGKFGTLINCIDGRTQLPAISWIKEKYSLDYVDNITEPGPDKLVSEGKIELLKPKIDISIKLHGSNLVVVSGHHGCAGNPISKEEHLSQIRKSIDVIKSLKMPVEVIGIWINEEWEIEPVTE